MPKSKTPKGALSKFSRQSHVTANGNVAVAKRLWTQFESLSDQERDGLVNLLLMAAASHFEYFLAELVRHRLVLPLIALSSKRVLVPHRIHVGKLEVGLEAKRVWPPAIGAKTQAVDICLEEEQRMVFRIVDGWLAECETSTFDSLAQRFQQCTDINLRKTLGEKTLGAIEALFGLRNIVAHGRDGFVPFECSTPPNPNLDNSPLAIAVNRLTMLKLVSIDRTKPSAALDAIEQVFSVKSAQFLYEMVIKAEESLLALPLFQKPTFASPPRILSKLSPISEQS